MPLINSHGRIFRDWESLIDACRTHLAQLPGIEALLFALEGALKEAKDTKLRQENLEGEKLATTQALAKVVDQGREEARRLRRAVGALLGTKSELLQRFGIAPIRRRTPRPAQTPAPKE